MSGSLQKAPGPRLSGAVGDDNRRAGLARSGAAGVPAGPREDPGDLEGAVGVQPERTHGGRDPEGGYFDPDRRRGVQRLRRVRPQLRVGRRPCRRGSGLPPAGFRCHCGYRRRRRSDGRDGRFRGRRRRNRRRRKRGGNGRRVRGPGSDVQDDGSRLAGPRRRGGGVFPSVSRRPGGHHLAGEPGRHEDDHQPSGGPRSTAGTAGSLPTRPPPSRSWTPTIGPVGAVAGAGYHGVARTAVGSGQTVRKGPCPLGCRSVKRSRFPVTGFRQNGAAVDLRREGLDPHYDAVQRAVSSAWNEHLPDTEGVTGSNPVPPTSKRAGQARFIRA